MLILVPIAFAAGIITAFTPCILPVLPIVLAGGGTGTKRRPYAIAAGLITTFTAFLLAGAWLWGLLGISAKHQIRIGAALLLVLAVILIFPRAAELAERPFLFLTRRRAGDLGGGYLLGASLGLVFVPCGGPVLATLTANAATNRVGGWIVVIAIAYAVGAALPMLAIARGSHGLTARFRRRAQTVRIAGGILMAVSALVIYEGWAESLQTKVPGYAGWVQNAIEGSSAAQSHLGRLAGNRKPVFVAHGTQLASRLGKVPLKDYGAAPDVHNISAWINSRPLSLHALRGKVVLVDFWTYSCINCLRTLPYLKSWDERYRSKGLVILGVHTPEFAFEHDLGNVRAAVKRLGVRYPVALDNDYGTWNAFGNNYWPADYLVDQSGHVRDVHIGEGGYSQTDRDIRLLLAAGAKRLPADLPEPDRTPIELRTPETYLGYDRIANYAGSPLRTDRAANYTFPSALAQDAFAYAGTWTVAGERIVAGRNARLRLHFQARSVHLVLGGHGTVGVTVDGRRTGKMQIDADRLYTLVSSDRTRKGLLELRFTPGLSAYAFTFG
ncbi:MAG: cytochrome c biogenesis protein DipZ [Actinobacteria bacterium]|nr:MAG: cytochrome c biogenesis protein DipZ [Actinomycetota bacterium]